MLVRSKFFFNLSKKLKKLELTLSKQHNKMLKIRSKMLKTVKNVKMIKLGKISQKFFPRVFRIPGILRIFGISGAFLRNVPSTSRTLLFSDKAWVYKRHFVLDCNDCSMAQWLGAQRREASAALVLGSILVVTSLITCFQESGSSR